MNIHSLAEQFGIAVHTRHRDDRFILGRVGEIYPYDSKHYAVMFMPDPAGKKNTEKAWAKVRKEWVKNGFIIVLDCDGEGVGLFSPEEPAQARLAIRSIRARKRP